MKVRAVIDKIEENYYAVLLVGDGEYEVDWPYEHLPAGAKEGDILEFEVRIDKAGTKRQKEKIVKLIEKLKNKQT